MNPLFDKNSIFGRAMSFLMVIVFTGIGLLFIFVPDLWEKFTGNTRIILGLILLVYAGVRAYLIIKGGKKNDDEE